MKWFDDVVWRLFGGGRRDAYEAELRNLVIGLRRVPVAEAKHRVLAAINSGRLVSQRAGNTQVGAVPMPPAVRDLFAEFAEIGSSSFRISVRELMRCQEPSGFTQIGTEHLEGAPIVVAAPGEAVYVALPDSTLQPDDPYAHASVWHYILFQLDCPRGP